MERVNVRRLPDDWGDHQESLLQAIDDATATPIYVTYALATEWFVGIHAVIDELEAVVPARPSVALALIEHMILRLDRAVGGVDDDGGGWRRCLPSSTSPQIAARRCTVERARDPRPAKRIDGDLAIYRRFCVN